MIHFVCLVLVLHICQVCVFLLSQRKRWKAIQAGNTKASIIWISGPPLYAKVLIHNVTLRSSFPKLLKDQLCGAETYWGS